MKSPIPTDSPLFLNRPDGFTLLSRTYRLIWHDGPFIATDGEVVEGECLNKEQELHINWETLPSSVAEVLLHEAGHALYHMFQGDALDRDEEDFVNTTAIAQVTLIRQNPKLWRWLLDMIEAG